MSTRPAPLDKSGRTGAERTRRWRERLRAKGLRPRLIWTFDMSDPAVLARLEADCAKLRGAADEIAVLEEIEALYELNEPYDDNALGDAR